MNDDGWTFKLSDNGESVRCERNGVYLGSLSWEPLRRFVEEETERQTTKIVGGFNDQRLEDYMRAEERAGRKP